MRLPRARRRSTAEKKRDSGTITPAASYLNARVAAYFDSIETQSGGVQIRVITTKRKAEWDATHLSGFAGRFFNTSKRLFLARVFIRCRSSIKSRCRADSAAPWKIGAALFIWSRFCCLIRRNRRTTRSTIFPPVTAHDEMAHKWFGDLVTMAQWDNLWLNEGFASWMGTKMHGAFQSGSGKFWLRKNVPRDPARRVGIAKEQAMVRDARSTTPSGANS